MVFDDDFTTVPYMEAGTLPPNWEDLVAHSQETATAKEIDLADSWFSAVAEKGANEDQLSDPFAIVTDPTKRRRTCSTGALGDSKDNPSTATGKGAPTSDDDLERYVVVLCDDIERICEIRAPIFNASNDSRIRVGRARTFRRDV